MSAHNMEKDKQLSQNNKVQYELVPPDGGWGHAITASVVILFSVTFIPMTAFGLIFGKFLASVGDETTGTTLANGIFNTILSFTGLVSNHLLLKYSYRTVAYVGAVIYCLGSISTVFVTSMYQMVFSFGVIQGVGFGLLMPAVYTAFNAYFDKKLNFMMGIAQAVMIFAGMVFPMIAKFMMETYGFRGTVALLAGASLNVFFCAVLLQPVEWHMLKKKLDSSEVAVTLEPLERKRTDSKTSKHDEAHGIQLEPLLHKDENLKQEMYQKYISPKPRPSIISVGDRALSVNAVNLIGKKIEEDSEGGLQQLIKSMSLFKDVVFMNISCGLALSYTADVAFISIIPLVLTNLGFSTSETALSMTVYFGADLVSRILYSAISAFCNITNRYVFLAGSVLSAVFRVGFIMSDVYWWKLSMCGVLGFLRCLIQTPLPLVVSEEYPENFATAFSLYMVVCGVISLIFGPLMSVVKSMTGSDTMVIHLLTAAYAICGISWIIELVFRKKKNSTK